MSNLFKNKKLIKFASITLITGVLVFCAIGFASQQAEINRLKAQKQEYTEQLATQNEENEQLQSIVDSDNTDSYIEQKAREKGYAKSNEVLFYDISSSK